MTLYEFEYELSEYCWKCKINDKLDYRLNLLNFVNNAYVSKLIIKLLLMTNTEKE